MDFDPHSTGVRGVLFSSVSRTVWTLGEGKKSMGTQFDKTGDRKAEEFCGRFFLHDNWYSFIEGRRSVERALITLAKAMAQLHGGFSPDKKQFELCFQEMTDTAAQAIEEVKQLGEWPLEDAQ